jgi:hypothetical protein
LTITIEILFVQADYVFVGVSTFHETLGLMGEMSVLEKHSGEPEYLAVALDWIIVQAPLSKNQTQSQMF